MEFVVLAVFGLIVALIAQSKGRSAIGWFFIGAIAPCIGLILVLVLPDLKAQDREKTRIERENRRLKERLRKDRQVADQRHSDTVKRLGAHDAVLGVDTAEAPEDAPPQLRPAAAAPTFDPSSRWHYAADAEADSVGPIDFTELCDAWSNGDLDENSLVWTKGMDDWLPIADVNGLEEGLRNG